MTELSSPEVVADSWEIRLYGHPDLRMAVRECGLFRSKGEACRVGTLVRMYLQYGLFGGELRAALPDTDDQLSLFALPSVLESLGHDPVRVLVTVGEVTDDEVSYDRAIPAEAWREDAGSVARGPHVNVRARVQ